MSSITCGLGRAGGQPSDAEAITANRIRIAVVRPGSSLVSAMEMAMIGPISPIDPLARMFVPSLVGSTPASPRIGSSVPIAVVVSAIATNLIPDVMSSECRIVAMAMPRPSEIIQPLTAA